MRTERWLIVCAASVGLVLALTPAVPAAALTGPYGVVSPTGTNPATELDWAAGDEYRLVFVTSTTRDAISADIADYNAFVNAAADLSTLPGVPDVNWFVIGSTSTVRADVNTGTATGPGVPILLLDATSPTLVFDVYSGSTTLHNMWSPTAPWAAIPINKNESGVTVVNQYVFTGSNPANGGGDWALGTGGTSKRGNTAPFPVGSEWKWCSDDQMSGSLSFYALSEVLTLTAIPEPSTVLLVLVGGVALYSRPNRRP